MDQKPIYNDIEVLLPKEPEQLIELARVVINRHVQQGVYSPLSNHLVAELNFKWSWAKTKHDEGIKYKKLMEEAFAERNKIITPSPDDQKGMPTIEKILKTIATDLLKADNVLLSEWAFQFTSPGSKNEQLNVTN